MLKTLSLFDEGNADISSSLPEFDEAVQDRLRIHPDAADVISPGFFVVEHIAALEIDVQSVIQVVFIFR